MKRKPVSETRKRLGYFQLTVSRLERDIKAQAESLEGVLQYQFGVGASSIREAAAMIRSCSRVLITGLGASMYAAIPLKYFFCALGIEAVVIEAGELLHYLHAAYRDSLVIIVSRSGESVEIAKLFNVLSPGQTVIGVTNEPASLLAKKANVSIHIGSLPDEIVAIQSYTGTLLTLHILGSAIDDGLAKGAGQIAAWFPEFAKLVSRNLDCRQEWDGFLQARSPVHLLARGPSLASAMEGALLFNEIAKHPAIGMPTASFRHGPVEQVDENFRGLLFAPAGRTRELNLALADDVKRFGGQIKVIGPMTADRNDIGWLGVPECPEALAPLFEVIPVQAAALRMAELRGIAPGSFRFASQVTTDEASFKA